MERSERRAREKNHHTRALLRPTGFCVFLVAAVNVNNFINIVPIIANASKYGAVSGSGTYLRQGRSLLDSS